MDGQKIIGSTYSLFQSSFTVDTQTLPKTFLKNLLSIMTLLSGGYLVTTATGLRFAVALGILPEEGKRLFTCET